MGGRGLPACPAGLVSFGPPFQLLLLPDEAEAEVPASLLLPLLLLLLLEDASSGLWPSEDVPLPEPCSDPLSLSDEDGSSLLPVSSELEGSDGGDARLSSQCGGCQDSRGPGQSMATATRSSCAGAGGDPRVSRGRRATDRNTSAPEQWVPGRYSKSCSLASLSSQM